MFVCKQTETIEYVKKANFLRKIQALKKISRQFLGFKMRNFQNIVFI